MIKVDSLVLGGELIRYMLVIEPGKKACGDLTKREFDRFNIDVLMQEQVVGDGVEHIVAQA
ncbi:hypothetical protein CEW83_14745 [Parazoarcus communis]|uniref:Uncharacterized protein n=1 Tax=Parazoarcus communis TaxID=41977 RepID=A0A2U8GTG6_9RHOO|nr:hypothetical protein [Parazoarcus communis]AWI76316.1 hypothetical protein CEW83_14745 [Parazoarcus communis]